MSDIQLIHGDCMEGMKQYPDNYFDIAIADPPYGIGPTWNKNKIGEKEFFKTRTYQNKMTPDKKHFDELFRVSKNWIIWGSNYFSKFLPPSNKLICWDKECTWEKEHRSEFELAQTSVTKYPAVIVRIPWSGARKGNETGIKTIHPHQKPVPLYKWLLEKYAQPGDKILDTHIGSGSIAIACHYMGFDLTGFELDKDYFEAMQKRIKEETAQKDLFG